MFTFADETEALRIANPATGSCQRCGPPIWEEPTVWPRARCPACSDQLLRRG
ncbi:hypothetical protein [Nocardia sp. NPDC050710]|uniref:hypothetical protein n=1 Tax=Nocardia sp. NPDC050710 TaxID=3157220 RepID=UPI0033DFDD97